MSGKWRSLNIYLVTKMLAEMITNMADVLTVHVQHIEIKQVLFINYKTA